MASHINRFKWTGDIEGISYILLLVVAMPLKYMFHIHLATKIAGSIHGGLFVLFMIFMLECGFKEKWSLKMYALAALSSFIPFGTFWFNKKMLNH